MTWHDALICGDNTATLARAPDHLVDLTVTSPPYDQQRDYHTYTWDAETLLRELLRVTKPGGVCCWVADDSITDGHRSLTHLEHALLFRDLGWAVHDLIVWQKHATWRFRSTAYTPEWELIICAVNGQQPNTFNPITEPALTAGTYRIRRGDVRADGKPRSLRPGITKDTKKLTNVWHIHTGNEESAAERGYHPAPYPEALAARCIRTWSNPGDLICDPFVGSGTTTAAAAKLGRSYLGIDISPHYIRTATQRTNNYANQLPLDPEIPPADPQNLHP